MIVQYHEMENYRKNMQEMSKKSHDMMTNIVLEKLGYKFFTLIRCSKYRPDLVCLLGFTTVWLHEFLKTEVNTGHNVGRLFPFSAKVG
jgi:hypothetical protein